MSSIKLVKVVNVVEDSLYWGANNEEKFKSVEAIEETGWWMTRLTFFVNKSKQIYNDVTIGAKLRVKVSILGSLLLHNLTMHLLFYFCILKISCSNTSGSKRLCSAGLCNRKGAKQRIDKW